MLDSTGTLDFYVKNDLDMRKIISHTVYDASIRDDMRQDFYLRALTTPMLVNYDSSRAAFGSYIYACAVNVFINAQRDWTNEIFSGQIKETTDDVSYDVVERINRFKNYIINNSTGADQSRALSYFHRKRTGQQVKSLGQYAWKRYHDLLGDFLRFEKFSEY